MAPFLYNNSWPAQRMYRCCCLGRGTSTCAGEMGRGARPCPCIPAWRRTASTLRAHPLVLETRCLPLSYPLLPSCPHPPCPAAISAPVTPATRQPGDRSAPLSHFSVTWLWRSAPAGAAGPRSFPRTSAQCLGPGGGPASHARSVQEVPWTE